MAFFKNQKELQLIVDLICAKKLNAQESFDAGQLILLVNEHRLIQSIYPILSKNAQLFPAFVRESLKNDFQQSKYQLLNFANESIEIAKAFNEAGIAVIFHKGIFQSYRYTNDFTNRHCKDIDILVKPDDIEKADAILKSLNFSRMDEHGITLKQKKVYQNLIYNFDYFKNNFQTEVELHWKLNNAKQLSISEKNIWENKLNLNIQGVNVSILNTVDNFIQLIIHGTRDGWFRLHWLLDIKQIIEAEDKYFIGKVLDEASKYSLIKPIFWAFSLLEAIFEYKIEIPINYQNKARNASEINSYVNYILTKTGRQTSFIENMTIKYYSIKINYKLIGLQGLKTEAKLFFTNPKNWKVFYFPDNLFYLNHLAAPFIWLFRKLFKEKT